MYVYDSYDQQIVDQRVVQFKEQTERFLAGQLAAEEFLPLRLQNGLYVQRHAPMLRIAVPYGLMTSTQLRKIADVSRRFDKGYVHFTTRQNIQLNWPALEDVPEILKELASVQMHAIQTSGNCIRNTTTDQFAGVIADEIEDPRPWCELIRQWSTLHPEFAFLPRKFKIAVNGSQSEDRAAIRFHDIGLQLVKNDEGKTGFKVYVGGGLGRTPLAGQEVRSYLEQEDLITYLEAILRVYNVHGRRDNKYKARIKILVKALGVDKFRELVDAQWQMIKDSPNRLTDEEINRVKSYFTAVDYQPLADETEKLASLRFENDPFDKWMTKNVQAHKEAGYAAVTLSVKKVGHPPGDATDTELEQIADLADQFSQGELRVSHQQNVVFSDVKQSDLFALWQALDALGFADPTVGTLNDVICCPGGDYCALANAKSIPIAEAIQTEFNDLDYLFDLGDLDLNISGCMNACGHHHIGHIGVLGVDKKGEEFYQVSLGGDSGVNAQVGKILGPSFKAEDMPGVIKKIIDVFVESRSEEEPFISVVNRLGLEPFKERVYAKAS
ncbi:nitrite/sulfite reductase [Reinekea marinisedimentorum]|uniref:Sulfite reductase (NADPH) hemoprotein beta-component n=1 Tax=Reinekea marinisedimentorum TaxID=230495 RepID=A0A4R3IAY2_9GAMM|nr:nitrite/sulfite reductase [Reinekea marinisedimentorum]TCS42600.1 sulfite reductase (NADPH) hemoprotein beta-component [Reinekea marinisedimentorum]